MFSKENPREERQTIILSLYLGSKAPGVGAGSTRPAGAVRTPQALPTKGPRRRSHDKGCPKEVNWGPVRGQTHRARTARLPLPPLPTISRHPFFLFCLRGPPASPACGVRTAKVVKRCPRLGWKAYIQGQSIIICLKRGVGRVHWLLQPHQLALYVVVICGFGHQK